MEQSKRDKIFRATLEMISSNGFHKSPISSLANKAKVAVGTIYHYFDTKEILIAELFVNCMEVQARIALRATSGKESYKEKFGDLWKSLYEYAIGNPKEFRFVDQYQNSPLIVRNKAAQSGKLTEPIRQFIQEGIKNNQLKKLDVDVMVDYFSGTISSAVRIHLDKMKKNLSRKDVDQFVSMTWSAMKR